MKEPVAYWNGQIVPFSSVSVSPIDIGFVMGATVAEQMRTFGGQIFRIEDHLSRLTASLRAVDVLIPESADRLADLCHELVAHNHPLLERGDDLGLAVFVTPGVYSAYGSSDWVGPTVCAHTYPLPFSLWNEKYVVGQNLVVAAVRQVPSACWPSTLKCRSRMHYYLADLEADAVEPGARALLLDMAGHVTEASTANVLIFQEGEGLVSPPHSKVLPGISLAEAVELGGNAGFALAERNLTPADVASANEVFLTSTPLCLLPVVSLDGRKIGEGKPGDLFRRLIGAWSELVGVDIVRQANRFSRRT